MRPRSRLSGIPVWESPTVADGRGRHGTAKLIRMARSAPTPVNSGTSGTDVLVAKRERIETVLDRARPYLRADGLNLEIVEVNTGGATLLLTGQLPDRNKAPFNFEAELEEVLRREIKGFGKLSLLVRPA
jgi:hypothetical protein